MNPIQPRVKSLAVGRLRPLGKVLESVRREFVELLRAVGGVGEGEADDLKMSDKEVRPQPPNSPRPPTALAPSVG